MKKLIAILLTGSSLCAPLASLAAEANPILADAGVNAIALENDDLAAIKGSGPTADSFFYQAYLYALDSQNLFYAAYFYNNLAEKNYYGAFGLYYSGLSTQYGALGMYYNWYGL